MVRLPTAAFLVLVLFQAGCGNPSGEGSAGSVRSKRIQTVAGRISRSATVSLSEAGEDAEQEGAMPDGVRLDASICDDVLSDEVAVRRRAFEKLAVFGESVDEPDDELSRQILTVMTAGLKDDDESVRAAAFDALLRLPLSERKALCLQALGNDDPAIKLALLELTGNPQEEFELTFNFQALDAEEPEVRRAASDNLRRLVGRDFGTAEEAFAWWESFPAADRIFADKERKKET